MKLHFLFEKLLKNISPVLPDDNQLTFSALTKKWEYSRLEIVLSNHAKNKDGTDFSFN